MDNATGDVHCTWQGRRLAWFIAVGKRKFFYDILHGQIEALSAKLAALSPADRGTVLKLLTRLVSDLLEELTDKLSWTDHCPYSAIGAFHITQGGDERRCRELLASSIAG